MSDDVLGWVPMVDGTIRWGTQELRPPHTPEQYTEVSHYVLGIDAYQRAVAHELKHKWFYDQYHHLIKADGSEPWGDRDGDGLPNCVEENELGTRSDPADSTGHWAGTSDAAWGDAETFCQKAEVGVYGSRSADWSDRGLNKGAPIQREFSL